ncbi:MAG: prolyl oligopeptidase family serine peptidase, partial [Woeseia sp.]|nr:prolyl oligopeptidase family serine peptidase [Woeseia sp.]
LSYSPYDNVGRHAYPNMLVTTGLHDSQVQYWEPAKWVAKINDFRTNDKLLLLKTDMQAGHSGKTGRYQSLEDTALYYSFYLWLEDIRE